jgi:hypothetical protein
MVSASDGRVITFYSYKGGTGRSMALAHAAWITAARGYRVLAIDWDLEAPGLHKYFAPFLEDGTASTKDGLIDFLLNYCDAATMPSQPGPEDDDGDPMSWMDDYAEIWRYAERVDLPGIGAGGCLDFVSAGRQDGMYGTRVNLFDWHHFYGELGGGAFLNRMRRACIASDAFARPRDGLDDGAAPAFAQPRYDFVFIDSRTGLSDTSGICTAQMPDTLVGLFTYNVQSIEGASRVLRRARAAREKLAEDARAAPPSPGASPSGALRIIPVPSRAESGDTVRLSRMRDFALPHFAEFIESSPCDSAKDALQMMVDVELPYIYTLSYNEVLSLLDEPSDAKSYLGIVHRLTNRICPDRGNDSLLALDRPLAASMWARYQAVLTGARRSTDALPRAPGEALPSRDVDRVLQAVLVAETDAGRISVRRVVLSLAGSGAEQGLPATDMFAPYAMSQFRQPERDAAERLVRAGILCARFDPAVEGRVIAPVNDDGFRASRIVQEWLAEFADLIGWKQDIGHAYARATIGADQVILSDAGYEASADLERRYLDELNPREQRIWRVVKERKRNEVQRAAEAVEARARLAEVQDRGDAAVATLHGRLHATVRRVRIAALVALLIVGSSGSLLYAQQQKLQRSAASTAAWESTRYGNYQRAIAAFGQLIDRYPDDPGYRFGRAYARARLLDSGRPVDGDVKASWMLAATDMEEAIKLQSTNHEVVDPSNYYNLVRWYDKAGDRPKSVAAARRFIDVAQGADNAGNFIAEIATARALVHNDEAKGGVAVGAASKS